MNNFKIYKLNFVFAFVLINAMVCFAQGENNIWHINYRRALNFNNTPTEFQEVSTFFFSNGPSSTVCNKEGELLFYSDGQRVFDRENNLMPNGNNLKGSSRATMPVLSIPVPEQPEQYYIFSLEGGYSSFTNYISGTLSYSKLDLTLNNGNGDIISEEKNIQLQTNLTGRLIASPGSCGSMWVLTHELNTNRFFAYEITKEGIKSPIISAIGSTLTGFSSTNLGDGMMKFSPNYEKLILFGGAQNVLELYNFDKVTGKLSNLMSLSVEEGTTFLSSGSFSPDNNKLYVFEANINENNALECFQYDLKERDLLNINASKTLIRRFLGDGGSYINMELGADNNLYMSGHSLSIRAILNPNASGEDCNFIDSLFFVNNNAQIGSFTGLHNPIVLPDPPSLTDSLLLPQDTQLCQNTQLTLQIQAEGDTYRWQDGSTTKDYEIIAPGTYWVEVQKGNCTFTDTLKILADDSLVELGKDTTICQNEQLTIEVAPQDGHKYQWQDGSTNPDLTISAAGLYWVESTDSLCSYRDSILVEVAEIAVALPEDTVLCPDQNLLLDVAQTGVDYEWQDGSTQATFSVSAAGTYWVEAQKGVCVIRDSIQVDIKEEEESFLPNDTILCNATDYLIIPDSSFKNIIWWQSPLSGDSLLVTESGTYHALPENNNCSYSDSITVTFQEVKLALPADTTLCMEDNLLLDIGTLDGNLTWQDGSTDQQFLVTESGRYWVDLTKDNCTVSDSLTVTIAPLRVDFGQDTTLCENESLALAINIPNGNYEWQDGSQAQNYIVTQTGLYWAKATKDNCVAIDSILVNFTPKPRIDLGVDTTLCIDESLTLTAPTTLTNYKWQDGTSNATQLVSTSGNYWLEGAMANCIVRDSISITFETCPEETQFCDAYLPNSFSPNGDGINDELQLLTDCELQFFEMEVYDRWGNLIFSTDDEQQTWDGRYKGQLLDTGVYLWVLRYQFLEQAFPVERVETVTVVR